MIHKKTRKLDLQLEVVPSIPEHGDMFVFIHVYELDFLYLGKVMLLPLCPTMNEAWRTGGWRWVWFGVIVVCYTR